MFRTIYQHQSYKRRIQPVLREIATGKLPPPEIIERLKNFQKITHVTRSYNGNKSKWTMEALQGRYKNELSSIFSKISVYLLKYESMFSEKIPIFYGGKHCEYTFSKRQMLSLMCMMSMCLVPPQQYEGIKEKEPRFNHLKNFSYIFSFEKVKTVGIIEYLKRQLNDTLQKQKQKQKEENLTIKRLITQTRVKDIVSKNYDSPMGQLMIKGDNSDIEDFYGSLKVDFSNKYIGGGSLIYGCAQEQIMFILHPEMYVSMILAEVLSDNEALQYVGFKKYFNGQGYGGGFSLLGFNEYKYEYDQSQRPVEFITAIDAINFPRIRQLHEFSKQAFERELLKAYTGFNVEECKSVASGNWGCGVFGGDLQLKFLIQWLATSLAGKKMIYSPFGKKQTIEVKELLLRLQKMKVGEVYEAIERIMLKGKGKKVRIYEDLMGSLQKWN